MSDADWASCIRTRHSFTGSLIKLAGAAVAYKTTQFQDTVATSLTESEFMASYELGKALLYVRSILWDLDVPRKQPAVYMRITTLAQQWLTHRNQPVVHATWTFDITSSVNGSNGT
jgi:cytochrome c oxidase assembly factor CtaG